MEIAEKIKSLLKGAEVYRSQGLLNEAQNNFKTARKLIASHNQIKNREALLKGLDEKLAHLEAQIHKIENTPLTPEISAESQTLIKNLFSFARTNDPDSAALEGATALIKFGQYHRAIEEFEALLENENMRFVAAKNILRCDLNTDAPEKAVEHYRAWLADPRFGPDMMGKIKGFLEMLFSKKGITTPLPEPGAPGALAPPLVDIPVAEPDEAEVIDINAVSFQIPQGPLKGRRLDYEVSFQSGNLISILLAERDKEVFEALQIGETLAEVELTSPIAIFNGTAKIMEKNQIKAGPRKGCFSIGLKVTDA